MRSWILDVKRLKYVGEHYHLMSVVIFLFVSIKDSINN